MTYRFNIPFRYKLTVLISLIVIVLLSGLAVVVTRTLWQDALRRTTNQLGVTDVRVQRLLGEQFHRLAAAARAISGNALFFESMLLNRDLDVPTRNDILENEILVDYADIDQLIVTDGDGGLLAYSRSAASVHQTVVNGGGFQHVLETGDQAAFFLAHAEDQRLLQYLIEPIFSDEGVLTGVLAVGNAITTNSLTEEVKVLTDVDLGFVIAGAIYPSTRLAPDAARHWALLQAAGAALATEPTATEKISIRRARLLAEPFLCAVRTLPDPGGEPIPTIAGGSMAPTTYVLLKSLRPTELAVRAITQRFLIVGLVGIGIAAAAGFLFALRITRPIGELQAGAQEVAVGNYEVRVDIHSNDEFDDLGNTFNAMVTGLAEKEKIRNAMDKVVSREIADEMLSGEISLGGEETVATVLFSDIRDFTAISESMSPTDLLQMLNDYFTRVNFAVDAFQGVIDKFMGDAVMALFGIPRHDPDAALHAVQAALCMLDAVQQFNLAHGERLAQPLRIGIGINTDRVVAGNMGSESRLNYTVIGDAVNLASRLEGLSKRYRVPIVIGATSLDAIGPRAVATLPGVSFRQLDVVAVKGKQQGVAVFEVMPASTAIADREMLLSRFAAGRELLRAGKIEESYVCFQEITATWPEDGPSAVFLERCRAYRAEPQRFDDEYQDGLFVAREK